MHQDYLKAGVDICCTNTLKANAFGQKDYKTVKFVTEMNKAAASHLGDLKLFDPEVARLGALGLALQPRLIGPAKQSLTNTD